MSDRVSVKMGVPHKVTTESTFELNHFVYPVAITYANGQKCEFERRYSDFYALRKLLANERWYCVVPPVPEKELLTDDDTVQYRKVFLKLFLTRVACHPDLGTCELFLYHFPDDQKWSVFRNEKIKTEDYFSKSLKEKIMKIVSVKNNAKMAAAGPMYIKAVDKNQPIENYADWELVALHIEADRDTLSALQSEMRKLAQQRKGTSSALESFSTVFQSLSETEDDKELQDAIQAIHLLSKGLSAGYESQSKEELEKVVYQLGYLAGMSDSAIETVSNVFYASETLANLTKELEDLNKSFLSKPEEKRQAIRNNINITERKLEKLKTVLEDSTIAKFREELAQYHASRQVDVLEVLRTFSKIQMKSSGDMKNECEKMKPAITALYESVN